MKRRLKNILVILFALLCAYISKASSQPSSSCIHVGAVNNLRSIQMRYTNHCGECVKFIPVIASTTGQTFTGANFGSIGRAMAYGDATIKLENGNSQDVFFDFRVGTFNGKANSVKSCTQPASTKPQTSRKQNTAGVSPRNAGRPVGNPMPIQNGRAYRTTPSYPFTQIPPSYNPPPYNGPVRGRNFERN